jgi:neutral ceramidase
MLKAGGGKSEFRIPGEYGESEGFTAQQHPVYTRALYLLDGDNKILIISVEMTSIFSSIIDLLKKAVIDKLREYGVSITASQIWIAATHTFSVPHLPPEMSMLPEKLRSSAEEYLSNLRTACIKSCVQAVSSCESVTVRVGRSQCFANCARDIKTDQGWWTGQNPDGYADHTLTAVSFVNSRNELKYILWNYPVQSSVLDHVALPDIGKIITSDLAGYVSDHFERKACPVIALFLVGAAGNQVPREAGSLKALNDLGKEVLESLENAVACGHEMETRSIDLKTAGKVISVPGKVMSHDRQSLQPVKMDGNESAEALKKRIYQNAGEKTLTLEGIKLGDLALVGLTPELNIETAEAVCGQSPFRYTLINTMVNGASKYMADSISYERFTYEAQNSPYAQGAAEIAADKTVDLLKELAAEQE